jgi:hypothetical protein
VPSDDLEKVRDMLRHAAGRPGVHVLQARRVQRLCDQLRSIAAGMPLSAADDADLHRQFAQDLVERDTPELVPLLWHELEADQALRVLVERIEAAGEIFETPRSRLLAFVIPVAIRLTSFTERRWRVPLTDHAGRWPAHLALRKRLGATRCVIDPHIYDGPMLTAIRPKDLRRHLLSLLQAEGAGRIPEPLVEPIVVHALPEPHWNIVFSIGVALWEPWAEMNLNEMSAGALADLHFCCEIAFPLRAERMVANKIGSQLKCQGIRRWHDGLRLGSDALRRYRHGQQQWTGDSARHSVRAGDLEELRRLVGTKDSDPSAPA